MRLARTLCYKQGHKGCKGYKGYTVNPLLSPPGAYFFQTLLRGA